MAKDIQGMGLLIASRFAGSRWANKLGLRKPVERIAYLSTRMGFKFAGKLLQKRQQQDSVQGERLANSRDKKLFDLSLTEEQQMIKDSVRDYAHAVIRPLATSADEQKKSPSDFLQNAMALGLNLFSVPESMGGAAQQYSPTTSAIIAEELGWGDFALATTLLAPVGVANALVRWGTLQQQQQWLPLWLADAAVKATIAVQEANALFDPLHLQTSAHKTRHGFVLNGIKTLVPLNGAASLYLIAAQYNGAQRVFIVPATSLGLTFKRTHAMGVNAAELGTLTLKNVELDANALLGGEQSDFNYQEFIDLGQLHWCSLAIGTCQAALDYVIPYCNERTAFGEPISHRQSVAFLIADMATEIEGMRLLTWRAAALAEQGLPFHREAYLAHLLCAEKAMKIGTDAVQLLGGHGFTKEHPAERWYRDLRILSCISSGLHA